MVKQVEFLLKARSGGFHLITEEITNNLPDLPKTGLLNILIKHTSAALTINENADPDVITDIISGLNQTYPVKGQYLMGN